MRIYAVTPIQSQMLRKLRRCRFDFAAPGLVDRGDGYTILVRVVRAANVSQVLDRLNKAGVTAWAR
jgi:hypothetical protein